MKAMEDTEGIIIEDIGKREEDVMAVAVLAGHILVENGAEIFRVEETIRRISEHYGVHSGTAFVLTNGIFATAGNSREKLFAKVLHIPVQGANLDRIAQVNQLSREIDAGKYTLHEAAEKLEQIRHAPSKRKSTLILAAALGSGAFSVLFGGSLADAGCAALAGLVMYAFLLYYGAHFSKIVKNIAGALIVTLICGLLYLAGVGPHLNFMIIGAVMPMVPGVAFTNSIRDFADGDYISGAVRMLDALMVFASIALGVGFGISLLSFFSGGINL